MQNVRDIRDKENLIYILSEEQEEGDIDSETLHETAIILYLYYEESFNKYLSYLKHIPEGVKVYVVTANHNILESLNKYLYAKEKNNRLTNVKMLFQPNRGRDVAALIVTCREVVLNSKYFCFVHDKKAKKAHLIKDTNHWIANLWNNTLASKEYIKNVINIFETDTKMGVLSPPEPLGEYMATWFQRSWYNTFEAVKELQRDLNLNADIREEIVPYTIGNALWGRTAALEKLFQKKWTYEDFAPESEPVGMISYAIERIWAYVAQDAGYKTGTIMTVQYASEQMIFLQSLLENSYWALNKFLGLTNTYEINHLKDKILQIEYFYKANEKIYIYGAGKKAKDCLCLLHNLRLQVQGAIVSDKSLNPDEFMGIKVYSIDEIKINSSIGIIIAVGKANLASVEGVLRKRDIFNYIYFADE